MSISQSSVDYERKTDVTWRGKKERAKGPQVNMGHKFIKPRDGGSGAQPVSLYFLWSSNNVALTSSGCLTEEQQSVKLEAAIKISLPC